MSEESTGEEDRRTTYLELSFDLVLVFAITQLATLLHEVPHHHAGHQLLGWAEVGLLSAMIWWLPFPSPTSAGSREPVRSSFRLAPGASCFCVSSPRTATPSCSAQGHAFSAWAHECAGAVNQKSIHASISDSPSASSQAAQGV